MARLELLDRTAGDTGRELGLKTRRVYTLRDRIRRSLGIEGIAGLAQAVFTAVLREIAAELDEAGGPSLLAVLGAIRADGQSPRQRRRAGRYRRIADVRLRHFVHLVGLAPGRQQQVARRYLRDMSRKASARELGVSLLTLKTYIRRTHGSLNGRSGAPGRSRLTLDLAEAVFAEVLSRLGTRLREAGTRRRFDLAAVLDDLRGEAPEDGGVGEARR